MTARDPKPGQSINSVPLDLDDTLEALSNRRRRFVIKAAVTEDESIDVGTLAESIALAETDADQIDAAMRKSAYVALIQVHLDTLDDVGAIDYDDRGKTIEATDTAHRLVELIKFLESVCDGDA